MATAKRRVAKTSAKKSASKRNGKVRPKGKRGTARAKVELSAAEVADRSECLARALVVIDEHKDTLKSYAKAERAAIKMKEDDARVLGAAVISKQEERDVEVEITYHGQEIVTTRVDTGEVLEKRLATDSEQQGDMFGGGG